MLLTSSLSFLISTVSSSQCLVYCHLAVFSLSTTYRNKIFLIFFILQPTEAWVLFYISTVLKCNLLSLKPHCGEAPRAEIRIGTGDLEAGTLTTRPQHLHHKIVCCSTSTTSPLCSGNIYWSVNMQRHLFASLQIPWKAFYQKKLLKVFIFISNSDLNLYCGSCFITFWSI